MGKDHGPSIKDDARYERLREQGYSKAKSAAIANTDAETAGRHGGGSPPYEEWTKDELDDRAREPRHRWTLGHGQGRADRCPPTRLTRPRRPRSAANGERASSTRAPESGCGLDDDAPQASMSLTVSRSSTSS